METNLLILLAVAVGLLSSSVFATDHVYVADYYDVYGDTTIPMLYTLCTFQGVVNVNEPRLFIIRYEEDYHWLEDLNDTYGISHTTFDSPFDAFNEPNLTMYCDKYVVYDNEDCNLAINNAFTLAGITSSCVVEKGDVDVMTSYGFGLHSHSDANMCGYWNTNEQAQSWGYSNLRNDCNNTIFGVCRGTLSGNIKGADSFVQQNMFVWCIDSKPVYLSDYSTTQTSILNSYDPNTISYGRWMTEGKDVRALGQYGHAMVGHGPNGSVYKHLPEPTLQQNTSTSLIEYDPDKTYIFVSFSQGGNMDFCQSYNLNYLTAVSATDPNYLVRERYPFGLFQSVVQYDLQPNVPRYYYSIQDPNQFFTGKGFGYTNPTTQEDYGHLGGWLAKARTYMDLMDHPDIMVNDNETELDPSNAVIKKICEDLQPRSIIFKHQLNPGTDEDDAPEVFYGVPVFGDPIIDRVDENKVLLIQDTIDAIVASAAKRQFFWVFWSHATDILDVEQLLDQLTASYPDIVLLNPDKFIRLYLEYYQSAPNYPTDDAYVKEAKPTNNYGDEEFLRVRGPGSNQEIFSYLKFDVSVSGSITSAKLKLRAAEDIENCTVYEVSDTSWSEATITWDDRPSVGSSLDTITNISSGQWYELDVGDHITTNGIYSLVLKTTINGARDWYSKESANKPELIITTGAPDTEPPSPDPMTWTTVPYSTGTSSISMTATTATDESGVEYYFDCTTAGGHDSNWQDETTYEDTGLEPDTQYTYQVKARDKSSNQNETAYSTTKSATTDPIPQWTQLTYDDFETGWGSYTDGGADCSLYTKGSYAHQGDCAIDIQDNSGVASSFYYTNGVDVNTPGYSQIKVEFWYYPYKMEDTEDFWVQYYDGSQWHTVAIFVAGTDFSNDSFYEVKDSDVVIDSSTYDFPTDMKIRFMCDASDDKDDIFIDEVKVSAN